MSSEQHSDRVRFQSENFDEKFTIRSSMRSASQNANITPRGITNRAEMQSHVSNVNDSKEKLESKEVSENAH